MLIRTIGPQGQGLTSPQRIRRTCRVTAVGVADGQMTSWCETASRRGVTVDYDDGGTLTTTTSSSSSRCDKRPLVAATCTVRPRWRWSNVSDVADCGELDDRSKYHHETRHLTTDSWTISRHGFTLYLFNTLFAVRQKHKITVTQSNNTYTALSNIHLDTACKISMNCVSGVVIFFIF